MDVEPDGRRLRMRLAEHDLDVLLARADDIPVLLDDRAVDVGIAGANQVAEAGVELASLLELGYGRCRLALAAPAGGPVREARDLEGPAGGDLLSRARPAPTWRRRASRPS